MRALGIVGAVLMLTPASVMADEPADRQAKQEKKICRTEKITGSLTRVRRICMTQSEWDRLAEGTRDGVDDIVRDANQSFAIRPCAAIQGCVQN